MNEVGPITEHVFEAKRLMYNLLEFMRNEHFTEEQIAHWKKNAAEHNMWLMNKAVLRLRGGKEKKAAVKCLEHWKMWINIKRLFKFYIEFGNSSVQYGKCDMRWAFDKWRRSDEVQAGSLRKFWYQKLTDLNIA